MEVGPVGDTETLEAEDCLIPHSSEDSVAASAVNLVTIGEGAYAEDLDVDQAFSGRRPSGPGLFVWTFLSP
jgi:hypothetical protein